ncbi:uncharacterized protein [Eleutherodactylus coqui]|uniref:uncharacterized protein n=1 Tax=Eleutherodactylus coqui TaxID=57060 RepID=UPI00346240B3
MDPYPAGHSGDNKAEPIKTQPQWQNTSKSFQGKQLYNPRAVVPPGLECLVEVDEVTLEENAFYTRSGQTIFMIRHESECCGPSFNLRFGNRKMRDVVSLCTMSTDDCCGGGDSDLKITVLPTSTIGFVKVWNSSRKMNASIEMRYGEPAFTAELPLSHPEKIIEIISVNGSCPVAKITTEGKRKSSKVIFQFPMDMEATLKTAILAMFLYMMYRLNQDSRSSYSSSDTNWGTSSDNHAGFFTHGGFAGGLAVGGGDWGGGGGGDCGDSCCGVSAPHQCKITISTDSETPSEIHTVTDSIKGGYKCIFPEERVQHAEQDGCTVSQLHPGVY